jgi:hypothetical protein
VAERDLLDFIDEPGMFATRTPLLPCTSLHLHDSWRCCVRETHTASAATDGETPSPSLGGIAFPQPPTAPPKSGDGQPYFDTKKGEVNELKAVRDRYNALPLA